MKLFTTSIRNLYKFKLYTIINIVGLATSLVCAIFITRYVHQETNVNHFIDDLDRVSIMTLERSNQKPSLGGSTNLNRDEEFVSPLEDTDVELSSSLINYANEQIMANDHQYGVKMYVVDSTFLQIIPYAVMLGSNTLEKPEDVIITAKLANHVFGNSNPIGQTITLNSGDIVSVVGVLSMPSTKSSFDFDILINNKLRSSWMRLPYEVVKLHKGVDVRSFNERHEKFHRLTQFRNVPTRYQLFPLKDFHFDNSLSLNIIDVETFNKGNNQNVLVLSIAGLLILLIGLFNYVNIYAVITLRRSREFGIKKIYGAKGIEIFSQLYLENFMLVAISVFVARFILEISERLLVDRFGLSLHPNQSFDILLSMFLLFIVPLVTSIFPYLRYKYSLPISSLSSVSLGGVSLVPRTAFLFLQYAITFALIVVSMYFMKQLNYMLNTDIGYDTEDIVVIKVLHDDNFHHIWNEDDSKNRESYYKKVVSTIESRMNESSLFSNWTFADPRYKINAGLPLSIDGGETHNVGMLYVSNQQIKMYNYQLLEGRLWDSTDISHQYRFIINEAAKKAFNITDIQTSYLQTERRLWYDSSSEVETNPAYEIVGVVKDFNTGHLSKSITPTVMIYMENNEPTEQIMAKIVPGKKKEAIEYLKGINRELYGEADFNYSFVEDEIAAIYNEDKQISLIYMIFSFIAIFVSSLGLFALSLFDIQQRYREIALRKINGATAKDIMKLVLNKYIYLLAGAFAVAIPLSYFAISKYIEGFSHKTAISWWLFAIAAIVVTAISLITLMWQVNRAMKINPARVLKGE